MKPRAGDTCAVVMGLDVGGYGIVRSLARERVPVVGLWRRADECGRASRYCRALQVAPDHDDVWVASLLELARHYDRPVLFPSNDRYAELLARHRVVLEPVTRFHWVDGSTLDTVIDKTRIGTVCTRAGLAVPRTHAPRGPEVAAEAAAFGVPCVVKSSSFRTSLPNAAKVIVCETVADLVALYERWPSLLGVTVWQEIIAGGDDAIYQGTAFAARPGRVAAVACVRKLRQYPPDFGITSFGCTAWEPDVVAHTETLVRALAWRGIASVEFKRSARDGRLYFIEMNPRMPWYNVLFADAGINLSYLRWCDLTHASLPAMRQSDGVGWMSLASDVTGCWERLGSGTFRPGAWLGSLSDARSFSWFTAGDPWPALAAALRLTGMAGRAIGRVIGRVTNKTASPETGLAVSVAVGKRG